MTTPTVPSWAHKTPNDTLDGDTRTLTGIASGTPIVVITATDYGAPADLTTPTSTACTGWTDGANLKLTSSAGATGQPQMKVWAGTVATAGGTVIGAGPAGSAFGMIVIPWADVLTSDFPDAVAESHTTGTHTADHTAPSVTVDGTDDRLVIIQLAADSDGGTTTTTGNYSAIGGTTSRARVTYNSGSTRYMSLEAFDKVLAASGATGATAYTYGDTTDRCTATLAIRGTSGGTTFEQSVVGSSTPTGAMIRQPAKVMAGSTTPPGSLTKQTAKPLAGSTTPTGLLAKLTGKRPSGSSTPTGAPTKQTSKTLAGSTTPTSALATTLVRLIAFAGSSTPVGALIKQAGKLATGSSTPTSGLTRLTSKALPGSSTPSGSLAAALVRLISLAGSSAPLGALAKEVRRALVGSSTPTGATTKRTAKTTTGSSTPLGAALKLVSKLLTGTSTTSGSVVLSTGPQEVYVYAATLAPDPFAGSVAADPHAAALAADPWTATLETQP